FHLATSLSIGADTSNICMSWGVRYAQVSIGWARGEGWMALLVVSQEKVSVKFGGTVALLSTLLELDASRIRR
ncbi:MAG TPA: hypothetical protein VI566_12945, partial [Xanthomonadales bacterium]|nr:hypothetical protein [Xanthomonadales bacterium]